MLGEAGLGKSRLVTEVSRKAADRDLLWLEGRALSFGHSLSYWPFLEILKRWAGISEDDSEAESWAKVERGVRALFPEEVAEVLPYLATLLGVTVRGEFEDRVKYLDGQAMGRQIFRTSRRFFERLARARPLVLVFEDVHGTDHSSAELLEHLFPLVESVPVLLCAVGRPERQSPAARLREVAAYTYSARYTEVALSPLSPSEGTQLVQNLLESDDLPPRVSELILQRTEGNPFFVEEVVRALLDMGTLVRDVTARRWRATAPVELISIPDTLDGVIMARVDRLEEEVKQVLRVAAVIGRSFFYRVLRALAEAERQLDQHLAELQHLELVREKRRRPELEYIFKHALVQEATYESILVDRRRELHRQVGECIETLFADRLEEFYGLLAYHYARAEEWEKAQDYLFKAGDQAGRIAADSEALAHYRHALATYARVFGDRWDPLQRAVLDRKMGEALFRRGDHQQAIEYLHRALTYLGTPYPTSRSGIRLGIARQLVQQVGHRLLPGLLVRHTAGRADPVLEERYRIYELMGWIDYFVDAERLVLDALVVLNFSERTGLLEGVVRGAAAVGIICDLTSVLWLAERYHRRAVDLTGPVQHPLAIGYAYFGLGMHEYCLGKWDLALEHCRRAAAAYREAGELRGWAAVIVLMNTVRCFRGEFTDSLEQSQELVRIGQDGADHQLLAWGLHLRGRILGLVGALDEAVVDLERAVELFMAIPDYTSGAGTSGVLGRCYLRQGKLKRALAVLEKSNQLIAERGLRGALTTFPRNALAEAYLVTVEEAGGAEKADARKKAKRACQAALKHGNTLRAGLPLAMRLRGTYEWLRDKPAAAQRWWDRSVTVAGELGARYDLGGTYLEMGRRMRTHGELTRAEAIFIEIGAALDLAEARDLLKRAAV